MNHLKHTKNEFHLFSIFCGCSHHSLGNDEMCVSMETDISTVRSSKGGANVKELVHVLLLVSLGVDNTLYTKLQRFG